MDSDMVDDVALLFEASVAPLVVANQPLVGTVSVFILLNLN